MKKLKGFTLIELIVVIAIIGILTALLVPNIIAFIVDSRFSTANSNAKLIYNASAQYCIEYSVCPFANTGNQTDGITQVAREDPDDTFLTAIKSGPLKVEEYISREYEAKNDFVTTLSLRAAVNKAVGSSLENSIYVPVINKGADACTVVRVYWTDSADSSYVGCFPDKIDGDVSRAILADRLSNDADYNARKAAG